MFCESWCVAAMFQVVSFCWINFTNTISPYQHHQIKITKSSHIIVWSISLNQNKRYPWLRTMPMFNVIVGRRVNCELGPGSHRMFPKQVLNPIRNSDLVVKLQISNLKIWSGWFCLENFKEQLLTKILSWHHQKINKYPTFKCLSGNC